MTRMLTLIKKNKVLTVILVLAIILRIVGVKPGFHPYHSDEGMSYSSAIEMIRNGNLDPGRYDYPSLVPIINMIVYIIFFIPLFVIKNIIFTPENINFRYTDLLELWQQIVIRNQQTEVLFWGRYTTAIFSIAVVFMVYLLGKKAFGKNTGLVAAFLSAVNFRQVLNSHLGLPDTYNAFFLLAALYSFLLLVDKPTIRRYIFSGIAVSFFFSIKYQIFVVPSFFAAHAYAVYKRSKKEDFARLVSGLFRREFILAWIVALLVILLLNPYHIINWEEFRSITTYTSYKYGIGVKLLNFYPISYLYHVGVGELVSIVAALGLLIALTTRFTVSMILTLPIFFFLFVFLYYTRGGYYVRNFVTITPLLLIFAAFFVVRAWGWVGQRAKLRGRVVEFIVLITAFLFSYEQFRNSVMNSYYFSKTWGFEKAANWAAVHMPNKAKVVSHPWDKYPRNKDLEIIPLETSTVFSLAEMQEEEANYAFINMDWLTLSSVWWMNRPTKESLRFWKKPDNLLANTYGAVAAQELASWAVAVFVKPWQAPDMNFLIVKIPPKISLDQKEVIANFSFDKKEDLGAWTLLDGYDNGAGRIHFDATEGRTKPGTVKIASGARSIPIIQATSHKIALQNNRPVYVEAWIKTDTLLAKKNRDGFIRVDFFDREPERITPETRSIYSAVSARMFGESWVKEDLTVFLPEGARLMFIKLETNGGGNFWFDDVVVYQSKVDVPNPRDKGKYTDYRIPDNVLFPYSQAGL